MSKDNTWNPEVQPDFDKLGKLDKLLGKIEGDIQKRVKDMDRSQFIETLKKSHEVYQLVLGELHFQFCELQLEKYGDIIMKIFTGQNNLINILLKMKTNLDFNPEQLMQNLENLKKAHQKERRSSFSQKDEKKIQDEVVITQQRPGGRKNQQMDIPSNSVQSKVLVDQFTSTTMDAMSLMDIANLKQKKDQIEKITKEIDEGQEEIEKFLNEKRNFNSGVEASQAENKLKNVLKDLATGQKKILTLEDDEKQMLLHEQLVNNQMGELQNSLKDQFKNMSYQKKTNYIPEKLTDTQKVINGVLIEIRHIESQADDQIHSKFAKLKNEQLELQGQYTEQGKKLKDTQRECNILTDNVKKLQETILELRLNIEQMKNEERKRLEMQRNQIIMGVQEKDRLKQITSENFKMKLKLKELYDIIQNLEKENKNNLQKFKNFILGSSGYTDEQKRQLIGKIEELFTFNISNKVNMRELEVMSRIDENMLKDKFLRDCIGDPLLLLKQIKAQQKDNKQKMAKKNYDADFDPDLLLENQELQVRKVKKLIKRKDSVTGEWIEEEIEVDELVVVDKLTGEVLRSKEIVNEQSTILDKNISQFMNNHGGLAIGGAKFTKPQPISGKRPKAKDGKPIVEGEWFEDDKGNMVRMKRNKNGEEEFEVKETYIDEYGVQRERIKKVKFKKDANGNDVVEEEYIDPKTGLKYKIEKKQYKDKDGNMVYEEVTIGPDGQRTVKRTKVKKDKNGNEIVEEEIIDQFGRKQIIKTKVVKDENGNDIVVQEIMNSDGTKTVITEKIGSNGQKIVIKETFNLDGTKQVITETVDESGTKIQIIEKVDKKGKKELVSEKKIKMGTDGELKVEEFVQDEKGNKVIKNTKTEIDQNGYEIQVSEVQGFDGKKKLVKSKIIKGEDGQDVEVEETIDEDGNVSTKQVKVHYDQNGNQIIVEEYIDAKGNKMIRTKKINVDGSIETEEFNPKTKEKKVFKQMTDENGRKIVEEVTTDKNGKKTVKNVMKSLDQNGNEIIQESYYDPITKKQVIVNKKVTVDKHGRQIIEENEVDEKGNVKNIKKKVYTDADGSEITEKEIIGQDGKKQKIKQKKYLDQYGNTIIEEERLDENGNKVIVKKTINKDGSESVMETTIGKDGKRNVLKRNVKVDGTIEEEVTTSDGRTYTTVKKSGFDDKESQTDIQTLESLLKSLGIEQEKINKISNFLKTGNMSETKLTQAQLNAQRKKEAEEKKKAQLQVQMDANLEGSSEDEEQLMEIDDNMTLEQQEDILYKKLLVQGGEVARVIRNQLGVDGNQNISKQQFSEYLQRLRDVHVKCGENCPHLKRFYAKLGFIQSKYKRKYLKMKDNKIKAFEKKLPKI